MAHYYTETGAEAYTVKALNGADRPTTIKDAKKMGLIPSVTTILDILDKSALVNWKCDQVALAARRLHAAGRAFPGDDRSYCSIVKDEAFQQVTDAADLGTRLHAAGQAFFEGKEYDPELHIYMEGLRDWVKANEVKFVAHEQVTVNRTVGYAGKLDAVINCPKGVGILDFKSRKTKPGEAVWAYDGQAAQIAAYFASYYGAIGDVVSPSTAPRPVGVNVFISTTEPGRIEAVWHTEEDLHKAFRLFKHLAAAWQILKGYTPPCARAAI